MLPKNSGGSSKFPGGHKVVHRTAQTAFVGVDTPRSTTIKENNQIRKHFKKLENSLFKSIDKLFHVTPKYFPPSFVRVPRGSRGTSAWSRGFTRD